MHTMLGTGIWDWEPWYSLPSPSDQLFWLGLYTTAEAKRVLPGLFHGSIHQMAHAARMNFDVAIKSLDTLIERELAEYDPKARVLRLTRFPDGCESPPSGNVIKGWWKRFQSVPQCQVRDAHVPTIWWLMEEWSRTAVKPISHNHKEAWRETFATIPAVANRRRGVRRLADSDTSTIVQPSLFDSRTAAQHASSRSLTSGIEEEEIPATTPPSSQPFDGLDDQGTVPHRISFKPSAAPAAKSDNDRDSDHLGTVPERFRSGSGSRSGSRSGSGSGSEIQPDPAPPPTPEPAHARFTPASLVSLLSAGWPVPQDVPEEVAGLLQQRADELELAETTPEQVLAAGKLARRSATAWLANPGIPPTGRWAHWAATPGNLARALSLAREHEEISKARSNDLAAHMATLFGSVPG